MKQTLWCIRCPVPTASGIAYQRGMLRDLFEHSPYWVRNIRELDEDRWDPHLDHSLEASFREGGRSPPIWARANGASTRLLGINFMNEVLGIYIRAEDPAETVTDLRGRRCALPIWPKFISISFVSKPKRGQQSRHDPKPAKV